MKLVTFFNAGHNGDIFTTREMVKDIIRQLGSDYQARYYSIKNPKQIKDVCESHYIGGELFFLADQYSRMRLVRWGDHGPFINTWVGAYCGADLWPSSSPPYVYHHNIFKECYRDIADYFEIKLDLNPDVWHYVPSMNYEFFDTKKVDDFLSVYKKVYLFSNGVVNAVQSSMGNMKTEIEILADCHKDAVFLATERFITDRTNIKFTQDIFQMDCDLPEISYLSSKINLIVGKNSGPFTYANTKENLLDESKIFVNFSHYPEDTLPYGLDFGADFRFSNTLYRHSVIEILERAINDIERHNQVPGYKLAPI